MGNIWSNWLMRGAVPELGVGWSLAIIAVLVWSLVWKGLALWKSAKNGSKIWFVVLLISNTVGILEILYIYIFSKKRKSIEHKSESTPVQ